MNVAKPIKHGTLHAYSRRKCRCDVCVTAMRKYHRERRRSLDQEKLQRYQRHYYLANREKLQSEHREASRNRRRAAKTRKSEAAA